MMRLSFKKTGDENSMNARQKRLVDFLPLDLQQVGHCRFGPLDGSTYCLSKTEVLNTYAWFTPDRSSIQFSRLRSLRLRILVAQKQRKCSSTEPPQLP
jgi:hypothetical protein